MIRKIAAVLLIALSAARGGSLARSLCDQVVNVPLTSYEGSMRLLDAGFCIDGFYFERLIDRRFWYQPPPTHIKTRFLYQSEGVIDLTAQERGLNMEGVEGYVAIYTPSMTGWKIWIRPDSESAWMPVRVADVAAHEHAQYHVQVLKSGFEVSYEIAAAWGIPDMNTDERGLYLWDAEICLTESDPNGVCSGEAEDLVQWFDENER